MEATAPISMCQRLDQKIKVNDLFSLACIEAAINLRIPSRVLCSRCRLARLVL